MRKGLFLVIIFFVSFCVLVESDSCVCSTSGSVEDIEEDEHENRIPIFTSPYDEQRFRATTGRLIVIPFKAVDPDGDHVQLGAHLPSGADYWYTEGPVASGFINWAPSTADVGTHRCILVAVDENEGTNAVVIFIEVEPGSFDLQFTQPDQTYYAVKEEEFMGFEIAAQANGVDEPITLTYTCIPPIAAGTYLFKQDVVGNPAIATFAWKPDIGSSRIGKHLVLLTAECGSKRIQRTVKIDVLPNDEFLQDLDKDGIYNDVDPFPITPSDTFADIYNGGSTMGTVIRGDQKVTIWDAENPAGVYVSTDPTGGLQPAKIIACASTPHTLGPGTTALITCGSVRVKVFEGSVSSVISTLFGETVVEVTAGNEFYYDPQNNMLITSLDNVGELRLKVESASVSLVPGLSYSPERGDTINDAQILTVNVPLGSSLKEADWDYYQFLASPGVYRISTSGDTDTYLTLYDIDGASKLSEDDDSGDKLNAHFQWECTESGTYYIKVMGFGNNTEGPYTINVMDASGEDFHCLNSLTMNVNFTYEMLVPPGETSQVTFDMPQMPTCEPYQVVELNSVTANGIILVEDRTDVDSHGNTIRYYRDLISENTNFTFSYNVTAVSVDYRIVPELVADYDTSSSLYLDNTRQEEGIDPYDQAIKTQASSVVENLTSSYWMAERLCRWVYDNILYSYEVYDDDIWEFTASDTLELGAGVCIDKTRLYVAMCRAIGIPSRMVEGQVFYYLQLSEEAPFTDYYDSHSHSWAEVYLPEYGWIWADPTWDWFADNSVSHIAEKWGETFWIPMSCSGDTDYEQYITYMVQPTDADEDNLTDFVELGRETNPYLKDTDSDGLSDEFELGTSHTDPNAYDTDEDYLSDDDEVNFYGTDPLSEDSDDDALSDFLEVFIHKTDPMNHDSDEDEFNDGHEIHVAYTDPLNSDTDGDGLHDGEEWKHDSNPTLSDSDQDGLSDGDEILVYRTDPSYDDSDEDGLTDFEEIFEYNTDPRNEDSDYDDIFDFLEINTYGTDPLEEDTDEDLIPDNSELTRYFTDPNDDDTDEDTLSDYDELFSYHTDPNEEDTDGDGYDDGYEVTEDSDPRIPSGSLVLSVHDDDGRLHSGSRVVVLSKNDSEMRHEGYTDSVGEFKLTLVEAGEYSYQITTDGYELLTGSVTVNAGKADSTSLTLEELESGNGIPGFPNIAVYLGVMLGILAIFGHEYSEACSRELLQS